MNQSGNPGIGQEMLEGRKISKSFGGLVALNQVNLAVHSGEIVGLVGPNGSGKTTLFNCLSRLQPIDSGKIILKGQEITHKHPYQLARMGMSRTFQRIQVYRQMTLLENLLVSRQWQGRNWLDMLKPPQKETRSRANALLDELQLSHLRDEYAGNLSGGQQRLLEIGMTLMPNPDLVLLDESTSGINPTLIEAIKDHIHILNRQQGITFLLIEHNINFISDLCDRLYVLHQGQILAEGTPDEIKANEAVIAAYFGS